MRHNARHAHALRVLLVYCFDTSVICRSGECLLPQPARIALCVLVSTRHISLVNIHWFFQFDTRTFLPVAYYQNDYE